MKTKIYNTPQNISFEDWFLGNDIHQDYNTMDEVITIGLYKGKTKQWIKDNNIEYYYWLMNNKVI